MKTKEFLKINDLIKRIKAKGIIINNENEVKNILEFNNYYYIMGYKSPFKDGNGNYKHNTNFNDIYNLYLFDKDLKILFLDSLLEIEQKLKTVFTNNFCLRYGYTEIDLLNPKNYNFTNSYLVEILSKLQNQLNFYGKSNMAVNYYKNNYSFVPLWVYIKVLTFGLVRDLVVYSKPNDINHITKKIVNDRTLKPNEIINMLELIIAIRNRSAHDEILFSHIHSKVNIKTTQYHYNFNLKKDKNGNIIQGKKDLFAVLIAIKFFASDEKYKKLINSILDLIDEYAKKISLSRNELLEIMHLPLDFEKIKDMK